MGDRMQKCCIRSIMFYEFNQMRRNDSRESRQLKLINKNLIMPCIRQLQYFKRAPVSWNGYHFEYIVKGVSFNYFKALSKGINMGT